MIKYNHIPKRHNTNVNREIRNSSFKNTTTLFNNRSNNSILIFYITVFIINSIISINNALSIKYQDLIDKEKLISNDNNRLDSFNNNTITLDNDPNYSENYDSGYTSSIVILDKTNITDSNDYSNNSSDISINLMRINNKHIPLKFFPLSISSPSTSQEKAGLIISINPDDIKNTTLLNQIYSYSNSTYPKNTYYIPFRYIYDIKIVNYDNDEDNKALSLTIKSNPNNNINNTVANYSKERAISTILIDLNINISKSQLNTIITSIQEKSESIRESYQNTISAIKENYYNIKDYFDYYNTTKNNNSNLKEEYDNKATEFSNLEKEQFDKKNEYDSIKDESDLLNKEISSYSRDKAKLLKDISNLKLFNSVINDVIGEIKKYKKIVFSNNNDNENNRNDGIVKKTNNSTNSKTRDINASVLINNESSLRKNKLKSRNIKNIKNSNNNSNIQRSNTQSSTDSNSDNADNEYLNNILKSTFNEVENKIWELRKYTPNKLDYFEDLMSKIKNNQVDKYNDMINSLSPYY